MTAHDAIVIGAGQSGLAAAHALARRGLAPVVLEAGAEPVGAWPHYYDSLTLFSPARYSSLPGMPFPGDPERYPHRDEVVDYLRRYAAGLDADIRIHHQVTAVTADSDGYAVHTPEQTLHAPIVISATGGFTRPHRPALPGLDTFPGTTLHASDYRNPAPFAGQRVVVVGAGNSAVQIAIELSATARVTLATRTPVRFVAQRPLGRDIHAWSTRLGLDHLPIGPRLSRPPKSPVLDTGVYRAALRAARPGRRPMFTRIDGSEVVWADGTSEHVDTIVLATGYRPTLDHLAPLSALGSDGAPDQVAGIARIHPGLGYVGLEWQRSLASATLRGVGRDAAHVVERLTAHQGRTSRCCAPVHA